MISDSAELKISALYLVCALTYIHAHINIYIPIQFAYWNQHPPKAFKWAKVGKEQCLIEEAFGKFLEGESVEK